MTSDDNQVGVGRGDGMRERRKLILGLLDDRGRVEVSDLSSRLSVTEETIRRDLRVLEQQGRLTRAHGGAVRVASSTVPWSEQASGSVAPGIVEQVLQLLPPHGAVYLDGGPAAERIAAALPEGSRIDLVTPGIGIAMIASEHPSVQVFSTGGYLDAGTAAEEGEWARQTLMRVRLDLAVIVAGRVSEQGELFARPNPAAIRETALGRAARKVLVLCSGEASEGFAVYGRLSQFDVVVTDTASARVCRGALERAVEVREVEDEGDASEVSGG